MDAICRRDFVGDVGVCVDEIGLAEGRPEFKVGVFAEWVEVGADGTAEESRVLRDDG